jgi:hypothetical protein
MRPLYVCAPTLLIALASFSSSAVAQRAFPLSAELGLGLGYAGHGVGTSGKAVVRLAPGSWGVGVRLMGMDGVRRRATSCFIFCNPIESFTEKSVLVYRRIVTSSGSRIYAGAGVGRLSGRRFIGSSTEFDRDLSELGLSLDVSIYLPDGAGIRFAPGAYGHVGPGGVVLGFTVGVAFTG